MFLPRKFSLERILHAYYNESFEVTRIKGSPYGEPSFPELSYVEFSLQMHEFRALKPNPSLQEFEATVLQLHHFIERKYDALIVEDVEVKRKRREEAEIHHVRALQGVQGRVDQRTALLAVIRSDHMDVRSSTSCQKTAPWQFVWPRCENLDTQLPTSKLPHRRI